MTLHSGAHGPSAKVDTTRMELGLTADQELVRATTRAFLESTGGAAATRALERDPHGWDPALWRRGAALGWTAPLIDEADGGGSVSGDGLADLAIVAEECGRLVAPVPLLPTSVVADALQALVDPARRSSVSAALLEGTATATFTPVAVGGAPTIRTRYGTDPGTLVLHGTASPVESVVGSSWILVAADGPDDGVTRVLVATEAPGVEVRPLDGLDLARRFAEVSFDGVTVPAGDVVGEIGGAAAAVERQAAIAGVLQCAETVGAIGEIFVRTVAYLGDRYSFGRPLASYQALKHRCADLRLTVERCAAIATAALGAVSAGAPDAAELVSIAQAFIGAEATEVVQDCVQLHGGIGVTWDHDLHLYLRRVTVNRATYGTPAEHLARVAAAAFAETTSTAAGVEVESSGVPADVPVGTTSPARPGGNESVDAFAARARTWLAANLPPRPETPPDRSDDARRDHERRLQRMLFDGGFAGICFPADYGGLGLTPAHQEAFTVESLPYDMPYSINVPTLGILGATLIDFGTHDQKTAHLPAILRGEELWVQFLSEPTGGSDLAGVRTTAVRDGDEFVVNGSKIWSSAAYAGDYAMCLARTDWDVPKHRGLTMFIVKIHQPGVQVTRIRQVDGTEEFCQEFFDDVRIPVTDVVGGIGEGWTVATALLGHERAAVGGGSPYVSGRLLLHAEGDAAGELVAMARALDRTDDPDVRRAVALARVAETVHTRLVDRVSAGLATGALPGAAGSLLKLSAATTTMRRSELALEVAGTDAVVWPRDGEDGGDAPGRAAGQGSLWRQALSLGGGSNEMQRNLIAERLLGMPREATADRDVPYCDVPHA